MPLQLEQSAADTEFTVSHHTVVVDGKIEFRDKIGHYDSFELTNFVIETLISAPFVGSNVYQSLKVGVDYNIYSAPQSHILRVTVVGYICYT